MQKKSLHEGDRVVTSDFREQIRREEMLSSLASVERALEAPPGIDGGRDLSQLASSLAAWIDAADASCGAHMLADEFAWAADTLQRFFAGQREAVEEIQSLGLEAEHADSPEELAHLNERAREAVGTALRLQMRKQRFVRRVRGTEIGGEE